MNTITEGELLWEPGAQMRRTSMLHTYMAWLNQEKGLAFTDYAALWNWSVTDIEAFWQSIWEFFAISSTPPPGVVLEQRSMPGAHWFPSTTLNYAELAFRHASAEHPAILFQPEGGPISALSWAELRRQVGAFATSLRGLGLQRGDRVAAYLPNIPEAIVAFLACASLGAIWSSCSPDMGAGSVSDRFAQIEPTILLAVDGYRYGGKAFDRRAMLATLRASLPTLTHAILVPCLDPQAARDDTGMLRWNDLVAGEAELSFEPVAFDHPLWVLYSSGTTGLPKPIVQGHGGILLEHMKSLSLHLNLGPHSRFFWFTTTGWMMWNFLVGGLLVGSTIVLYDGSPAYPDMGALWSLVEQAGITVFGASAAYLTACMKAGLRPGSDHGLDKLLAVGSTGSPLPVEGFQWVYEHVKRDLWLASISGGTDLCTAFVGGCPLLPVWAGEIQCRCLGARVEAFDEHGQALLGHVGELVISQPMPSMPIFFWNDTAGRHYHESYFAQFPGVWRHGDWIKITERGSVVIYGRSDSTINRMGIRMGTSEMYRAVEDIPEVLDSLVIDLEGLGGASYMPLFVVLREGVALDAGLVSRIKDNIRRTLSPRHVPDDIFAIPEVPRTLNGKKLEVPVKKILLGMPIAQAANPDAMSNPQSLDYFVALAARFAGKEEG